MSHQVIWSNIILNEFFRLANLTEEEQHIMRTRAAGWTITRQAIEFHMSVSKVNRIIKVLKIKYDAVQPFSTILPPRRKGATELYLDTH